MAFFRLIPNLTIMAPKDFKELEEMLEYAIKLNRPVIIRYPRGGEGNYKFKETNKLNIGNAEILKQGKDITIIGIGKTVSRAMEVAKKLEENNKSVEVINARFLKPFDTKTIKNSIQKTKNVITIEDGTIINGLATAVKELIIDNKIDNVKIKSYAYPDEYIKHGSVEELEEIYKVDTKTIIHNCLKKEGKDNE